MDNFNSLMTTDVEGLIQCDSKRVIKIATANIVLNSEPVSSGRMSVMYFFQEYDSRLTPKMESEIDIRS
jgi:hypothetical protein